MNSFAKFRGAARRGFPAIYKNLPGGGDIRPRDSVRELNGIFPVMSMFVNLRVEMLKNDSDSRLNSSIV